MFQMCGAMGSSGETPDFIADGLGIDDADDVNTPFTKMLLVSIIFIYRLLKICNISLQMRAAKSNFLELASQRFDDE